MQFGEIERDSFCYKYQEADLKRVDASSSSIRQSLNNLFRDPQNELIPTVTSDEALSPAIMSGVSRYLSQDGGIDDIISGLPRHVLDEIFDCLPIEDAARTCILSKKWRYIWAMYPYLFLDQEFFDDNFMDKQYPANKYVNAIDQILLHHDGPVLTFHIYIPNFFVDWDEHINRWLLYVSNNGVKNLYVDFNSPNYKLPSYVFSCPDLTHLGLNCCVYKPPVNFSGFANLVDIYFSRVSFSAFKYDGRSPVTPMLRTLAFKACCGLEYFSISAPQIEKIKVLYSHEVNPIFFEKFCNVTIIVIYIGEKLKAFYRGKGHGISFSVLHEKTPRIEKFSCDGYFLNISAPTSNQIWPSLQFQFLTILRLDRLSFDDFNQTQSVIWLLNSTPSLQKFTAWFLLKKGTALQSGLTHFEPSGSVGELLNLQSVELNHIKGSVHELLFIQCILASSPNLEYLRVKYGVTGADQQLKIFRTLMNFHRASAKAEIKFAG